jgi:pimeloyl-ACP methyl ester carboxylesterase
MKQFIGITFLLIWSSCQEEKIELSANSNETFYVQNGEGSLRVQVRGNTLAGKIVLTVHGGPGGSSYYLSYLKEMQEQIEPNFAVAYLDQPIAGASQSNHVNYSIEDYAEGIKKTISALKHRYGINQKIVLYSESWGGIVTTAFLTNGLNQKMVAGWINSDSPHDFHLQDREMIPMAITIGNEQIALGNNVAEWQNIVNYCETHDPTDNYEVAKELNNLLGDAEYLMDTVVQVEFNTINIFWSESLHNNAPFTALGFNLFSNNKNEVEKKAYEKHYEDAVSVINIPLLILWGRYDFIAPPAVADSLFKKVQSVNKQKVFLERSGHNGFLQEPDIYWFRFKDFLLHL